jgi:hypothetical protein
VDADNDPYEYDYDYSYDPYVRTASTGGATKNQGTRHMAAESKDTKAMLKEVLTEVLKDKNERKEVPVNKEVKVMSEPKTVSLSENFEHKYLLATKEIEMMGVFQPQLLDA